MANRTQSSPAHLEQPSMSEESVHVDQHVRSEVHRETQRQPSPPPQGEGPATNMEGHLTLIGIWRWKGWGSKWPYCKGMQRRTKNCFAIKTRSYIIREDWVQHPVTLEEMSVEWAIRIGKGIGDSLILMGNKRKLPLGIERFLHLLIRVEGRSRMGRGLKGLFIIPESLRCLMLLVRMPWVRLYTKYLNPHSRKR